MEVRLIDANTFREEWLENGENEYVYDTNSFLESVDEQPTIDPEDLPLVKGLRANIAILEKIIERNSNPLDKDKILHLMIENSALKSQIEEVTAERDAAAKHAMTGIGVVVKLSSAFPNGFVNRQGEFIAHKQGNSYFRLSDCETELDVKCKVLEWLSRDAYKTSPFHRKSQNQQFNSFILTGICKFMERDFTVEDMEKIYTYLGNRVNHAKTIRFIESGYDMQVLEG